MKIVLLIELIIAPYIYDQIFLSTLQTFYIFDLHPKLDSLVSIVVIFCIYI